MDELEVFHADPKEDRDPSRLAASLDAAFAMERWGDVRAALADTLALLGLPCWLITVLPRFPAAWRPVPLTVWAIVWSLWACSIVMQRRWRRRAAALRTR